MRSLSALPLLCRSLTAVAASRPSVINWRIGADVQTILQRTGTPGATILIAESGRIETCRFVDHLSDGIKDGDAFARCWLERCLGAWMFALSFELKAGRLSAEGIKSRQTDLMTAFTRRDKDGDAVPQIVQVGQRYPTIRLDTDLLSDETLVNLIAKGVIDLAQIHSELDESSYFVTIEQEPAWRTVWHSHERSEEDVNHALIEMERAYAAREYIITGEVMHVLGLRLWLSAIGAINESREQVVADGKAYVDDLYARGQLECLDRHQGYFDMAFDAYGGLGIHEAQSAEYRQLRDYLNEKRRAVELARRPAIAEELLANMQDDPSLFLRRVCLTNHEDNEFYDIPVMASLDPARFVTVFLGLSPRDQRNSMVALKSRYEHGRIDRDLLDERPWAIKVRNQILAASKAMSPISKDRLRGLLVHALDGVLGVAGQDEVEGDA